MNIHININKNAATYASGSNELQVSDALQGENEAPGTTTPSFPVNSETRSREYPRMMACDSPVKGNVISCSKPLDEATLPKGGNASDQKFSFEKGMVDLFTSFMSSFKEMMQQYMSQIKEMVSSIVETFKGLLAGQGTTKPAPAQPPQAALSEAQRKIESFPERMPKILSGHATIGHINEADLQAGIIAYQLYQKSEDAEQYFLQQLKLQDAEKIGQTQAIKNALISTQEASKISKLEANFVYKLSHRASQVDENHNEVSESKHGAGTMDLGNAIKTAEVALAKVIHGHIILEPRPLFDV